MPRLLVILCALAFLSALEFPAFVAGSGLDYSWMQALGDLFLRNARAGIDYVFTFGPLGYFAGHAYVRELWWAWLGVHFALAAAVAVLTFLTARRIDSLFWRLIYGLVVILFVGEVNRTIPLVLLQGAFLLMFERPRGPLLAGLIALFSVVSLIKFTFFVSALACVGTYSVSDWRAGHRRSAVSVWAAFGAGLIAVWVLAGQPITAFPIYVARSLEVVRGYSSLSYDSVDPTRAESLVLGAGVASFLFWVGLRRREWAFPVLAVFLIAVAWKQGYVRDDGHVVRFFGLSVSALLLGAALEPTAFRRVVPRTVLGLLLLLGVRNAWAIGSYRTPAILVDNVRTVLSLGHLRARLEGERAHTGRLWNLRQVRAYVGNQPVDVLSVAQGVLLANRLNWQPRPVFQSYVAYTKELAKLNREHFEGPRAPRFVLLQLTAVDNHFPTLEDAGVLLALVERYRPVLRERNFVLAERAEEGRRTPSVRSETRTIRFGERVTVSSGPDEYVTLALKIRPTLAGRLRRLLYRESPVWIKTRAPERERKFRIIPEIAEEPFLLTPFDGEKTQWLGVTKVVGRRVVSFVVSATNEGQYRPDIEVQLTARSAPPPDYGSVAQK